MNTKEQLETARRLIEGNGSRPTSKQIADGAKIVTGLAENDDCLDAWRYILECHERGIGPFKTNKFRRAAKEAIACLDAVQRWSDEHKGRFSSDMSWCDDKVVREAMLRQYVNARRYRDKFVEDCVKSRITDGKFRAAAARLGAVWNRLCWRQSSSFSARNTIIALGMSPLMA